MNCSQPIGSHKIIHERIDIDFQIIISLMFHKCVNYETIITKTPEEISSLVNEEPFIMKNFKHKKCLLFHIKSLLKYYEKKNKNYKHIYHAAMYQFSTKPNKELEDKLKLFIFPIKMGLHFITKVILPKYFNIDMEIDYDPPHEIKTSDIELFDNMNYYKLQETYDFYNNRFYNYSIDNMIVGNVCTANPSECKRCLCFYALDCVLYLKNKMEQMEKDRVSFPFILTVIKEHEKAEEPIKTGRMFEEIEDLD
jgi:hypothetical protein